MVDSSMSLNWQDCNLSPLGKDDVRAPAWYSGPRGPHKDKDTICVFVRPKAMGSPEARVCVILVFMWSFGFVSMYVSMLGQHPGVELTLPLFVVVSTALENALETAM